MINHFCKFGKMLIGGFFGFGIGLVMLFRSVIFLFTGLLGVDVDLNLKHRF